MRLLCVDATSGLESRSRVIRELGMEVVTAPSPESVPADVTPHAVLFWARGSRASVGRAVTVLRRLRAPVIVVGERLGHAVTAFSAGADDYWSEPLDDASFAFLLGGLRASRLPPPVDTQPLVFVADDDRFFCERTRDTLRELGCAVEVFGSGASLIERLEQGQRPALMVLDVYMPGVGGRELLGRLATTPGWNAIPIVVMSGVTDTESLRSDFMRLGARAFVAKGANDLVHLREVVQANTGLGTAARRRRERTSSYGLAQFRRRAEDPWCTGFVWNLGPTGVFLRTTLPAPKNAMVQLRVEIPGGDERLVTVARVAWSHGLHAGHGPYGMGLQLHELADEARGALEDLVALHRTAPTREAASPGSHVENRLEANAV